jgi:outer membrane protein assembly factor BamB
MRRSTLVLIALSFSTPLPAQQWPAFRGADASGVSTASAPVRWNVASRENIVWKTPIPGLAHSSPVIWGDRVYLTSAVPADATDQSVKTGNVDVAGIDAARDLVPHAWKLYALDKSTGRIVWERTATEGVPRVKRHAKASHASATPATDGASIVAMMGSQGLYCYDASGRLKWKQDLGALSVGLADDPSYEWGPASSPVIADGLVVVQNDRYKDSFLAAYDLATGREVWRSTREELPSWSTPTVVRVNGQSVVVTNSPRKIRGHDLKTGRVLWSLVDPQGEVKVSTPVAAGDLVIVTGGYPPGGRPIYAIRALAEGEIPSSGGGLAWRVDRGSPYTGTPVVYEGIVYVCTDNGIVSAYDGRTGERLYKQRLAMGGSGFSASPIVAGRRLYFTSEDGQMFVVRLGRTFELLATNDMGEVCFATPAASDGMLVVRTRSNVYGIKDTTAGGPSGRTG